MSEPNRPSAEPVNRASLQEQLAQLLYAAAHEACDETCLGGGMAWYHSIAALLVDPRGPLAEIAEAWHIDQRKQPGHDLEHWQAELRKAYELPSGSRRNVSQRRAWAQIGALAAEALALSNTDETGAEGVSRG